jgi:hypothetical protein
VSVILEAISALDLEAQLNPRALRKFADALVHHAPEMSPKQLANTADRISFVGMRSSSKGSAAFISAVAHALPKMTKTRVGRVCKNFRAAAKELKTEAWVPFLEALPGVTAKLDPRGVVDCIYTIGCFCNSLNISPDKHTINALQTTILQTAPKMSPKDLHISMLAFQLIPLPFDSPSGRALLAEVRRGMKSVDAKMLTKLMNGLLFAEVAFSEELLDALWTAVMRVAPSFTSDTLVLVLQHTAVLKDQGVIPKKVRTVLLQAVLRCAPLLDRRTTQATIKWLRVLGWEIPEEVFARLRFSVQ